LAAKDISELLAVKQALHARYDMSDLGELHWCLGMEITRDLEGRSISVSQKDYLVMVLNRFGMGDCKPISTPALLGLHLDTSMSPLSVVDKAAMEDIPFRAVVGSLMYAAVSTRPDIAASVTAVARFMQNPGSQH
jgi:hypothetical protein